MAADCIFKCELAPTSAPVSAAPSDGPADHGFSQLWQQLVKSHRPTWATTAEDRVLSMHGLRSYPWLLVTGPHAAVPQAAQPHEYGDKCLARAVAACARRWPGLLASARTSRIVTAGMNT